MGQVVFGFAGAFIGNLILPGVGGAIGWAIGSGVGSMLFAPDLPSVQGPRLSDLRAQSSSYGTPIPQVWGNPRMAGTVLWMPPIIEIVTTEEVGGKGGGGGQEVTTYSYYANAAIGICGTEIAGLRRIWADSKLIYSAGTDNINAKSHYHLAGATVRLYRRTPDQLPDPLIESYLGVGNVPAYRDWAYLVLEMFPLRDYGNRLPNFTFEVVADGAPAHPVASFSYPTGREPDTSRNIEPGTVYDEASDLVIVGHGNYDDEPKHLDVTAFKRDGAQKWTRRLSTASGSMFATAHGGRMWTYGGVTAYLLQLATGNVTQLWSSANSSDRIAYCPPTNQLWVGRSSGFDGFARHDADVGTVIQVHSGVFDTIHSILWVPSTQEMWVSGSGSNYRAYTEDGAVLADFSLALGRLFYDPISDAVWIATSTTLRKVDPHSRTVLGSVAATGCGRFATDTSRNRGLWVDGSGNLKAIDLASLAITTIGTGYPTTSGYESYCVYNPHTDALWYNENSTTFGSNTVKRILLDRVAVAPPTIGEIVTQISAQVGLSADDIDVTQLTDTCEGFVLASRMSARSAIEPLQLAYSFDVVERDGKVRFPKRGGATVATIPFADLGAHEPGTEVPQAMATNRAQEVELPATLEIQYLDPAIDYQVNVQRARRIVTRSDDSRKVDLPIVLSADTAKRVADRAMFTAWMARNRRSVRLLRKWMLLDPADPVELEREDGTTQRVVVLRTDYGSPGLVALEVADDDASIYTQSALGGSATPGQDDIEWRAKARLELMDIPILRDEDDNAGFYAAVCGVSPSWPGAGIYGSSDGGLNFAPLAGASLTPIGNAQTVLAPGITTTWDEVNSVTVMLDAGVLSSSTDVNVLNGANLALLGEELIQFGTVVDNGDGSYTLSHLLRGRRGSEWAIGNHHAGERFVLLRASARRIVRNLSEVHLQRHYKAVTYGLLFDQADVVPFTNHAVGLKPLSPVHITGVRDEASNLMLSAVRRSRLGGGWQDFQQLPLGEQSEAYEIDIMNGASVVRTLYSSTTTAEYSAVHQTTDFGAPKAEGTLSLRWYQMSDSVGRGFPGVATV
ncbi:MAG: phage tail protein [Burkholderiales bacterium]|nr:phage tail protein [Burkholderiales bacterium]